MIVERLDICEDTHGVRFVTHLQHVVHLDEPKAVGLLPETQSSQFRTQVLTFAGIRSFILLCGGEGELQVLLAFTGVKRVVVKLQGEEGVDQGAESHPITPAGREVLDVDVLTVTSTNISNIQTCGYLIVKGQTDQLNHFR